MNKPVIGIVFGNEPYFSSAWDDEREFITRWVETIAGNCYYWEDATHAPHPVYMRCGLQARIWTDL